MHGLRNAVHRRAARLLAGCATTAVLLITAAPASAGTWYITPTIINNTSYTFTYLPSISGVDGGDWLTSPAAVIPPGGSDTPEFNAPYYDEGAGWQGNWTMTANDGSGDYSTLYIEVDDEFETGSQYYCLTQGASNADFIFATCNNPDAGSTTSSYNPTITVNGPGDRRAVTAKAKGKRPRHHLPVRSHKKCTKADRKKGYCRKSGMSPSSHYHG
jgi:hypothetical protein